MKREWELKWIDHKSEKKPAIGGLAGWLLGKMHASRRSEPRLQLLERITLAPRQSLALVEADGRRLLVATSADGGPAFYALEEGRPGAARRPAGEKWRHSARVSW